MDDPATTSVVCSGNDTDKPTNAASALSHASQEKFACAEPGAELN